MKLARDEGRRRFILTCRFAKHLIFEWRTTAYYDLNLAPWETVLGTSVSVPTLDGSVSIKTRRARRPAKSSECVAMAFLFETVEWEIYTWWRAFKFRKASGSKNEPGGKNWRGNPGSRPVTKRP